MERVVDDYYINWKNWYEQFGWKVDLCNLCGKIEHIISSKPVDGPSISSGMICKCKDVKRRQ